MTDHAITQRFKPSSTAVTQRFPPPSLPVTERFTGQPVTQRYHSQPASTAELAIGEQIAGKYEILSEPLGEQSGEAEVYLCYHLVEQTQVVFKYYRTGINPDETVLSLLRGLIHPSIVSLLDFGYWQGRFYEVMEYCAGKTLLEHMPIEWPQLRSYLPNLLHGLAFCHQQGIIHRDIKPSNLFFRTAEPTMPVLGDFGISYLSTSETATQITRTRVHFSLDYVAPELLDRHEVSHKVDYYALGICLLHLFLGYSPFKDFSTHEILVAHLRGRVPWPDSLPEDFQTLLTGLLSFQPNWRWGYNQVMAWLKGQPIIADNGQPWHQLPVIETSHAPFPACPQATTPEELANHLDKFDAAKHLFSGDIRRWVFDHFDALLAARIEEVEEFYAKRETSGVLKLKYLLNPRAPLQVGDQEVHSIAELVYLLGNLNMQTQDAISYMLWNEALEHWIEAGHVVDAERVQELLNKISSLRIRLRAQKFQGVLLFALLYTLDPHRPFPLSKSVKIGHPRELGKTLEANPKLIKSLRFLVYSRRLEEWVRAAEFINWQKDVQFIENCRIRYLEQQDLGTYAIQCYYQTDIPFHFGNHIAKTAEELADLIDSTPRNTALGLQMLQEGWLFVWLTSTGRIQDSVALEHAILKVNTSWESKLESVLHLLKPNLPWPIIAVFPTGLNFGRIPEEDSRTLTLKVYNVGRGYLSGEFTLSQFGMGITLSPHPEIIEGNMTQIYITVNPLGKDPAEIHRSSLIITSNGGRVEVPINYLVDSSFNLSLLDRIASSSITSVFLRHRQSFLFFITIFLIFLLNQCQGS